MMTVRQTGRATVTAMQAVSVTGWLKIQK